MELTIRKMAEKDLDPLYILLSDPQVMVHLEAPFTKEQTKQFLEKCGLCERPLVWSVDDKDGFAGYVIFHDFDEDSMEIGWVLYPKHWGKGYATSLTRQLVEKGRKLGKQLVIECDYMQEATKHIALKAGFIYEGRRDRLELYRLKN